MQEREITSRIRLDELQGLLDTTHSEERARITQPMPAVTLEQLLEPEPPPPEPVHVTFRRTPRATEIPQLPPNAVPILAIATPAPTAGAGADDDFEMEEEDEDSYTTNQSQSLRDTVRMSAASALAGVDRLGRAETYKGIGVIGTINGVPMHTCGPDSDALIKMTADCAFDSVIDAAVDAAIDAEIHNAEIDAAIDAVVLPSPPPVKTGLTALTAALFADHRTGIIALSFLLSFTTGIAIMFLMR